MALNIFEELDITSSGDSVYEGFEKSQTNWSTIDTELNNARGGESTLDARLDKVAPVYKTLYIPARLMISPTTSGAGIIANKEYATNDVNIQYFSFGGTSDENLCYARPMPENWDRSTIKAKFFWAPGDSGCTAGDIVTWEAAAVATSNDDPLDAAYGTYKYVDDTVLAGKDGDMHVSGATAAITVAGTPALGDLIHFKFRRDADASGSGSDDMTEEAWLFGVWIQYAVDNSVTAW